MPILGPNCYGVINYLDGALLWFDQHGGQALRARRRDPHPVRQHRPQPDHAAPRPADRPPADARQPGQASGCRDCLAALVDDPRVTAIGLHIEAIDDVAAFDAAARKALAARKPVVAVKAGRSDAGAALALSHTASLAGADAAMDALLRRVGVARVASLADPARDAEAAARASGPLPGRDLVTLSCSGGEAALIADAGAGRRVRFRPFDAGAGRARCAPRSASSSPSPTRSTTTSSSGASPSACAPPSPRSWPAAGTSPASSSTCRAPTAAATPTGRSRSHAWEAARDATGGRAAVLATLPECLPEPVAERADRGRDRAARRHRRGARRRRGRGRHRRGAGGGAARRRCCRRPCPRASAVTLDEWRGKQLLAGVRPAAPGRPAGRDAGRGRRAPPRRLGYPVVVKAVGAALAHKSELGAVALDLRDAAAVEAAAARMAGLGEAILVEPMIADGVAELILGRQPRPAGRPVPGDRRRRRPGRAPGRPRAAAAADDRGRGARGRARAAGRRRCCTGFRGRPAGDLDAVVAAVAGRGAVRRRRMPTAWSSSTSTP